MFKLIVAAAMLISLSSVAFAVGGSSTRFYNTHTYVVGPNGGPAKVVPKQGMRRRNPANRIFYR
jgi:hypothetical protein